MTASFTKFQDELLVAAYDLAERTEREEVAIRDILEKYPISYREHWIMRALSDFKSTGLISDTLIHGHPMDQSFWLTAFGMRTAEDLITKGTGHISSDDFENVSQLNGRVFAGEGSAPEGLLRDGDIYLEMAPAADRIVPLNHDSETYTDISRQIDEIVKEAVETNDFGETTAERERLLSSLSAAQRLWAASELKVVQIRVGIILALQDAESAFRKIGKAVSTGLAIDLIKKLVKDEVGIDF